MDSTFPRPSRRDVLVNVLLALPVLRIGPRTVAADTSPTASRPSAPLTPLIRGPWFRIADYPENHLNDFCLFRDRDGRWHLIGIMGTGTWKSEQSLFHCSGSALRSRFTIHPPILTESPAPGLPPQKHAPFVVWHAGFYHLFYRRPPGTNLVVRSKRLDQWPGLGVELFAEEDARDVCVMRLDGVLHMYYCQSAEIEGVRRSCILLRRSVDPRAWSEATVVHVDTAKQAKHSYLESPFVVPRPEGYYLFIRHRHMNERTTTVVLFSHRPDKFPSGDRAWFAELDHVHAPEIVTDRGRYYIARVSGPPHANKNAPRKGGWIEVAELVFE